MLKPFKGLWFWVMAITLTLFFYSCCAVTRVFEIVFRLEPSARHFDRYARAWGRSVFSLTPGWTIDVDGLEHLPNDGRPLVIVSNHQSMTDIFVMYFLPVAFRWLSKEEVFKIPLVGQAMGWLDYVPVRRGNRESHATAMRDSEQRIRKGSTMLFFPEGTRSPDGEIKAFKLGAFKLARDTQVGVVPIALHGANNLLPKHGRMPQRAHVRLRVLPLEPPPPVKGDLDDYAEHVRAKIVAAHAGLV